MSSSAELRTAALLAVIVLAGVAGFVGLIAPRKPIPLPLQAQPPAARDVAPARTLEAAARGALKAAPSRARHLPHPATVVAAYYAALDARRFDAAWRTLSPPVRARFGSFAKWRAGYATTVSSRPGRIAVRRDGDRAAVTLVLRASDRSACGILRRTFTVHWELVASGGRWTASSITAAPGPGSRCTS